MTQESLTNGVYLSPAQHMLATFQVMWEGLQATC